jgi:hypothetical protein
MTEELKKKEELRVPEVKEDKALVGEVEPAPKPTPQQPAAMPTSTSFFFRPLSESGFPAWAVYALALLGLIYILNPTMGIIEFLPDNLPGVGNLDEGVAFMLLWAGLVEYFEGRKKNKE